MSLTEIKEGIQLKNNGVLYKTRILTEMNPKRNCIWSQFLNDDINKLISTCKLSPIQKSNYITTINENDLYHITAMEPMTFWEICGDIERKFVVSCTGFLQAKPKCTTKTDDFLIKRHDNIILNFTTNIEPFMVGKSFNDSVFDNFTRELSLSENILETKIISSKAKIISLKEDAEKIIKSAEKQIILKRLEHDSPLFSFSLPSLLTLGSIMVLIASCCIAYYCKCSILRCLYNIYRRREKKRDKIQLRTFREKNKTVYRKTPYVTRKNLENDVEMGSENEHDSE